MDRTVGVVATAVANVLQTLLAEPSCASLIPIADLTPVLIPVVALWEHIAPLHNLPAVPAKRYELVDLRLPHPLGVDLRDYRQLHAPLGDDGFGAAARVEDLGELGLDAHRGRRGAPPRTQHQLAQGATDLQHGVPRQSGVHPVQVTHHHLIHRQHQHILHHPQADQVPGHQGPHIPPTRAHHGLLPTPVSGGLGSQRILLATAEAHPATRVTVGGPRQAGGGQANEKLVVGTMLRRTRLGLVDFKRIPQ
mmetsp:Transcript_21863/g.49248  ORF Transcript_21863/g.49248 Transcript_21863/m.49248 type:complete len:250 (+) Transcript_21863:482-1231(+)